MNERTRFYEVKVRVGEVVRVVERGKSQPRMNDDKFLEGTRVEECMRGKRESQPWKKGKGFMK